jgi:2-amino-4-hydroxy-6-hydroxymethyldihydropteridine diphosphokinase
MTRRLPRELSMDVERVQRVPVEAVVALGANLGDRAATLVAAVDDMRRMPLVERVRVSDVVESVAIKPGGPDAEAPTYFNAVAIVTTRLAPSVLLGYLQAIEDRHGRERRERWSDRTLDLDIVAYGDVRSRDPRLTLPHPRAAERDFVLAPWLSLDPDAELPGAGRVEDLLERLRASA